MKKVALITNIYPYQPGEEFLDDEISSWSARFDIELTVYPLSQSTHIRELPPNIKLDTSIAKRKIAPMHYLRALVSREFLSELGTLKSLKILDVSRSVFTLKYLGEYEYRKDQLKSVCGKHDVIYSYWNSPAAFAALALRDIGRCQYVVSRMHSYDLYEERSPVGYLPLKRQKLSAFDQIFMISNQSKRYIETKYSEKNAVISRLGVAVSGHLNEGTGSNILRLISISSLTSVKRVHMIIECVSAISKRNPDLKLEWAHYGDGPLKTSLHEFATKSLGDKASLKWAFRGHVTNRVIRNKLCEDRWDAIINLSEYEGIPVSMMEAMSAGIPVIATDVGAVAELVDADYPLLFPVNVRPELVADTVTRHLPFIKCSETRQRCQAKIVESFNESRNYNDLIDSIVMTSCGKRPKGTITE